MRLQKYIDEMCGKDHSKKKRKKDDGMAEGRVDEKTAKYLDIFQGEHKSTLAYYEEEPASSWAMGNIPHNAPLTFSRKEVPKIIKLLKMKNSPLVREDK